VHASAPLISLIEEATGASDTVALLRLAKAGVTVTETAITSQSRACGHAPAEMDLPPGLLVVALVRDGEPLPPDTAGSLRPGDEVLLISHGTETAEVDAIFH
jgi:trk system potassium uptake protein